MLIATGRPVEPINQFCVQITVVVCHGSKGQSGVNLKDTIRLADPENPQFGANNVHVSLNVAELQLFGVAIGLNAIFQIFGENRENINFY